MTPISKVKTLIEYAKWGMFICKAIKNEISDEVCPPKAFSKINYGNGVPFLNIRNYTWLNYTKKVSSPYVTDFGGSNCLGAVVEVIDLPNCISIGNYQWSGANSSLRVLKLPRVRSMNNSFLQNCTALEYVEFGALTNMTTMIFRGSQATMREFYIGEGTACNLYLHQCPNLTQECLHRVIDNLADLTGVKACTLQIGTDNIAKLSEEYTEKLFAKNWSLT